MPWHRKAMKDAVSCDNPRIGANNLRSGGLRMGKPTSSNVGVSPGEYIARWRRTRGTETSKYPQDKKTNVIPSVAASERGKAQTGWHVKACMFCAAGVVGRRRTQVQMGREVTNRNLSRTAWEG